MNKVRSRFARALVVIALGVSLAACSSDQSSNILGSSNGLDRKASGPENVLDSPDVMRCDLVAYDIFGGADMPFELSCENSAAADHVILSQIYNGDGCLVEQSGRVVFTDSGRAYTYRASTHGCPHDGGTLDVCSRFLGGCRSINLPRLLNSNDVALDSPPK
jgi:hypothetical protein